MSEKHQNLQRVAKDLHVDFQAENSKVQLLKFDDFQWSKYLIIDSMEKVTKQDTAYVVMVASDMTNNKS